MVQRHSEMRCISTAIDQVADRVIRKFRADDVMDAEEIAIAADLLQLSDRQLRQADIADLSYSINRVGLSNRNLRRLRDLAGPVAANAVLSELSAAA